MADNRIYLRCAECRRVLYLGKRFGPGGYYWYNYWKDINETTRREGINQPLLDERTLEERLNEFFDEHTWCGDSVDHFDIVYEMDDDFNEKVKFPWEDDE